jgi:hypothetical protein
MPEMVGDPAGRSRRLARMIPSTWTPHRRADDGEVVGYLAPAADDLVVPMSLLGHALDEACDEHTAVDVLESAGLSMLAEAWRYVGDGADLRVRIVQVTPSHVVLKHEDFGDMSHDYGENFSLSLPAGDALQRV